MFNRYIIYLYITEIQAFPIPNRKPESTAAPSNCYMRIRLTFTPCTLPFLWYTLPSSLLSPLSARCLEI